MTGVLAPKGQTASGSDSDDVIRIPCTTAGTRLTGRPRIPRILASTASQADLPAAQEEIRTLLRESHGIGGEDDDGFTVRNQADLAAAAGSSTRVMTMLRAAIASISLLVGFAGSKVVAQLTGRETVTSPLVMIGAAAFSGAVGVSSGLYPARKAAALNPIEALRHE